MGHAVLEEQKGTDGYECRLFLRPVLISMGNAVIGIGEYMMVTGRKFTKKGYPVIVQSPAWVVCF